MINKRKIISTLLCLILLSNAQGQTQKKLDEASASLLEQVKLRQFDGREMAEIPLKLVLKLAIERSISLKASKLGDAAIIKSIIKI